ncbi:MAG: beta-galactosidase trimerization domain-containing protein, partial [Armatimonadetes bacterium]|nr:beta-galactosidase trimerization domain-containing protein [Armatimonadota bacterium]
DVADGILKDYRVLYVTESNLRRDAARAMAEWVQAGGTLCMGAGSGLRDEYDEPLDDLVNLAGVEVASVEKPGGDYREHYGIPHQQVFGEIKLPATKWWAACTMPVLGYREACKAQGAEVLATFDDGKPAVLKATAGKGTVLRFAFMPGIAYVRSANPGPNRLTVDYKPEQLSVLTAALTMARVASPIEVSEPLVEAQLLRGPTADVIVLANWAGKPLPKVKVTVREGQRIATAGSLSRGRLKVTRAGGKLSFELPLDATDVVVLRRR